MIESEGDAVKDERRAGACCLSAVGVFHASGGASAEVCIAVEMETDHFCPGVVGTCFWDVKTKLCGDFL